MEFFLKIKSSFNAVLKYETNKINLSEDNFITLKLNLLENEILLLNIEPLIENSELLFPYQIEIKNKNNKLNINSKNVEVYNYRTVYLLNLNKFEAVKDMFVLLNDINFSVYNTYCTNIILQNKNIKLKELYNIATYKKVNNNTIILLENELKKMVIVLHNNELIFKDYYSDIKISQKIEILSKINDISKHAIITTIENKNITKKIVYLNNSPKLIFNDKLIPLTFIQAVKIENFKLCCYYLNNDLKQVCSLENLKFYFGDFVKVEPIISENSLVLFYKDKSYKIFNFLINDHKICKIETI